MEKDLVDLTRLVLLWWADHQDDTAVDEEGTYKLYPEPPDFVILALKIHKNNSPN